MQVNQLLGDISLTFLPAMQIKTTLDYESKCMFSAEDVNAMLDFLCTPPARKQTADRAAIANRLAEYVTDSEVPPSLRAELNTLRQAVLMATMPASAITVEHDALVAVDIPSVVAVRPSLILVHTNRRMLRNGVTRPLTFGNGAHGLMVPLHVWTHACIGSYVLITTSLDPRKPHAVFVGRVSGRFRCVERNRHLAPQMSGNLWFREKPKRIGTQHYLYDSMCARSIVSNTPIGLRTTIERHEFHAVMLMPTKSNSLINGVIMATGDSPVTVRIAMRNNRLQTVTSPRPSYRLPHLLK